MDPLVRKYIDDLNKKQSEELSKKKTDLAFALGLFRKEYSDNTDYTEEYPNFDYDSESGKSKYYKKVPAEMTDEEYFEILRRQKERNDSKGNTIAVILKVVAWIVFFGGFFAGIIIGNIDDKFSLTTALICWSISFVSGMMFLGFAEVIQLLTDIKYKKKSTFACSQSEDKQS
ncbi:MAG: hypothetical protein IJS94_07845 [Clostridia bacterium]|nr:hypothetical protein [Clostridia bacterium]